MFQTVLANAINKLIPVVMIQLSLYPSFFFFGLKKKKTCFWFINVIDAENVSESLKTMQWLSTFFLIISHPQHEIQLPSEWLKHKKIKGIVTKV